MAVIDGRNWLEHLSPEACWGALTDRAVGRVSVLVDGAPEIYPVNFATMDRSVVFRTDPGSKLRGLDRSPSVCFEVDEFDTDARTGWSVMVKGRASEITSVEALRRAAELPLDLWSVGPKAHWIRIEPTEVTGRRIHPH